MGLFTKIPKMPETVREALAPLPTFVENLAHVVKVAVEKMHVAENKAEDLREEANWQDAKAKRYMDEGLTAMVLKERFAGLTRVTKEDRAAVKLPTVKP